MSASNGRVDAVLSSVERTMNQLRSERRALLDSLPTDVRARLHPQYGASHADAPPDDTDGGQASPYVPFDAAEDDAASASAEPTPHVRDDACEQRLDDVRQACVVAVEDRDATIRDLLSAQSHDDGARGGGGAYEEFRATDTNPAMQRKQTAHMLKTIFRRIPYACAEACAISNSDPRGCTQTCKDGGDSPWDEEDVQRQFDDGRLTAVVASRLEKMRADVDDLQTRLRKAERRLAEQAEQRWF